MPDAPDCAAPLAEPEPLRFGLPAGACDTHIHVLGPYARFPLAADRFFTPPEAPWEAYRALQARLCLQRAVIVHSAAHGLDMAVTEHALAAVGDSLRGVAMFGEAPGERELERLHALGFRGARLNVADGLAGVDAFPALAARIRPLGWHIQVLATLEQIGSLAPVVGRLPVPCVFDHMGYSRATADGAATRVGAAAGVQHPGFRTLLSLLREHGCWVKLSGIDRVGAGSPGWASARPRLEALVAACDRRLVWGSDWPHVRLDRAPDDGRLLNTLFDWIPDEALRKRILVDNPAALYQFEVHDARTH